MARILLGVTGGIAAFKSAALVRLLRQQGHEVRCILTRAATQFVTPLSLEILSENEVMQEGYLSADGSGEELHITAAEWAETVCVAPATTHTLVRFAHGLADDFLTTTLSAYEGPLVVAPAMHSHMWRKPTTVESVAKLRDRGVYVVGPVVGPLASGEVGEGRMSAPEEIAAAVEKSLKVQDYAGVKVLVTAGPTYEAIDPVRFIGNKSSGRMGFAIAEAAALRGAKVSLIAGPCGLDTPYGVVRQDVTSAGDMERALNEHASVCNVVVMCAAVADYSPADSAENKIKREGKGTMTLDLIANPDLLAGLAELAPRALRVGFAAETEDLLTNAAKKLKAKRAHFLCANDVSRSDIGFDATENQITVFSDSAEPVGLAKAPKIRIAHELLDRFLPRVAIGADEGRKA